MDNNKYKRVSNLLRIMQETFGVEDDADEDADGNTIKR